MHLQATLSFLACLLSISLGYSQSELYGSWQGKMRLANGARYVFNLDILAGTGASSGSLRGVAIHDRNGHKEVIELTGIVYHDRSIYLTDVIDRFTAFNEGKKCSKLQFLMKWDDGNLTLDGHWQEYQDLRKYRKGRLVLRKKKSKA